MKHQSCVSEKLALILSKPHHHFFFFFWLAKSYFADQALWFYSGSVNNVCGKVNRLLQLELF